MLIQLEQMKAGLQTIIDNLTNVADRLPEGSEKRDLLSLILILKD